MCFVTPKLTKNNSQTNSGQKSCKFLNHSSFEVIFPRAFRREQHCVIEVRMDVFVPMRGRARWFSPGRHWGRMTRPLVIGSARVCPRAARLHIICARLGKVAHGSTPCWGRATLPTGNGQVSAACLGCLGSDAVCVACVYWARENLSEIAPCHSSFFGWIKHGAPHSELLHRRNTPILTSLSISSRKTFSCALGAGNGRAWLSLHQNSLIDQQNRI